MTKTHIIALAVFAAGLFAASAQADDWHAPRITTAAGLNLTGDLQHAHRRERLLWCLVRAEGRGRLTITPAAIYARAEALLADSYSVNISPDGTQRIYRRKDGKPTITQRCAQLGVAE